MTTTPTTTNPPTTTSSTPTPPTTPTFRQAQLLDPKLKLTSFVKAKVLYRNLDQVKQAKLNGFFKPDPITNKERKVYDYSSNPISHTKPDGTVIQVIYALKSPYQTTKYFVSLN
jgi:hypothetical protein